MDRNGVANGAIDNLSCSRSHPGDRPSYKEFRFAASCQGAAYRAGLALAAFGASLFCLVSRAESESLLSPVSVFPVLLGCLSLVAASNVFWTVKCESLLLAVPLGLQLTTSYLFGQESTEFIPWHRLDDILIVEVITGQRVLYYLAASLLNDERSHIILFKNTRPRLLYLEKIYRETRSLIDANT